MQRPGSADRATHDAILALARLYSSRNTPDYDDRAATIEVQVAADIPISRSNLLGIVTPCEYMRDKEIRDALHSVCACVKQYDIYPLSME